MTTESIKTYTATPYQFSATETIRSDFPEVTPGRAQKPALTPQEAQKINEIIKTIDLIDPSMSLSFGAKAMGSISQLSDPMLERVKAKDADFIGEQLTDLKIKLNGINLSVFAQRPSFLARIPFIGQLFNKVERAIARFDTVNHQVDVIGRKLEDGMVCLLRDVEMLEQLYLRNRDSYHELTLYIMAGRKKLEEIMEVELPKAKERAAQSPSNAMAAQAVHDLMERVQRFERRLHDMELSRLNVIQTAPQIRVIQNTNQLLAEKIQSSLLTMIPIWKNQMVLALALRTQKNAAKLQSELTGTTNKLLRKNAEMLQMNTIESAKEVERSHIDIETLRDVQTRLLNTIDETASIANEARIKRMAVEQEMITMEQELYQRLTSITAKKVL